MYDPKNKIKTKKLLKITQLYRITNQEEYFVLLKKECKIKKELRMIFFLHSFCILTSDLTQMTNINEIISRNLLT